MANLKSDEHEADILVRSPQTTRRAFRPFPRAGLPVVCQIDMEKNTHHLGYVGQVNKTQQDLRVPNFQISTRVMGKGGICLVLNRSSRKKNPPKTLTSYLPSFLLLVPSFRIQTL